MHLGDLFMGDLELNLRETVKLNMPTVSSSDKNIWFMFSYSRICSLTGFEIHQHKRGHELRSWPLLEKKKQQQQKNIL